MARFVKSALLLVFVALASALLALGPRGRADRPRGRAIVTYWEKWTGREADQMKQIVDDFNASVGREKGIFVEYVSISGVDRKTLVSTAAGVPPDVAGVWDGQVPQFAAAGALEALDEMAAAHGITAETYKPVYWEGCRYKGRLYGLISTPWAVALHYNKAIFAECAAELGRAGLDGDRPPRTLAELDRYARVLDRLTPDGRIERTGYLPTAPGWFLAYTSFWFGGRLFDERNDRFTLTEAENVRAYEWIRSYSRRLGPKSITDFVSGFGNYQSTQNPFLVGYVAMLQQGPWTANYVEMLAPEMNRWKLGRSADPGRRSEEIEAFKARETDLPIEERRRHYQWGAAAFPSAVPGLTDVTFAGFDVLVIPRTARRKVEAFEFIAYVNRQDVMEKLCSLHCKNSPLREVSEDFIRRHPNPYIEVFERMTAGPNARTVPRVPIWAEAGAELSVAAQRVYLLEMEPAEALAAAQNRLQRSYERYLARRRARRGGAEAPAR